MYLGKMNRGLSLMALFFGDIALGSIFPPVFFLLPLIWFYAFFDCLNLSGLSQVQLDRVPDEFGFGMLDQVNFQKFKKKIPAKTGGLLAGWALIIVGVYMLYDMLTYRLVGMLESFLRVDLGWLSSLLGRLPQMLISVLIIWLGIRLIRGSKRSADDVRQYGAPRPAPPRAGFSAGGNEAPADAAPREEPSPMDTAASVMDLIRQRGLDRKPGELDIMAGSPEPEKAAEPALTTEPTLTAEPHPATEPTLTLEPSDPEGQLPDMG